MKFEKVKQHLKDNKKVYLAFGGGVIFAGISFTVVRSVATQPISRGISVTAQDGISVLGKKVEMHNVSYIFSHRQGPPSWVIRCSETNEIFTSQAKAAEAMSLPASEISKHLNGAMDHVRGFHFERICMAA